MKILVDIVHPAHVHFFKHIMAGLRQRGHEVEVIGREKDVTNELLDAYSIPYSTVGRSGQKSVIGQFFELVQRDWNLLQTVRKFKPDLILTRNPAGAQVARLTGTTGIFDTVDGRQAGVHFRAAAPFAHYITTPDCLNDNYGAKHTKYPGYTQLAYLHPDHFTPEPKIRAALGVSPTEPYFLLRFVAMNASHDAGELGMPVEAKRELIRRLKSKGKVFVSSEGRLPDDLSRFRIRVPAEDMHDVLAFARLFVGDSGTMAAEAAVLGTPNFHISSITTKLDYLTELEDRYGLTTGFHPKQAGQLLDHVDQFMKVEDPRADLDNARTLMLNDKQNIAEWYIAFVEAHGKLQSHFSSRSLKTRS